MGDLIRKWTSVMLTVGLMAMGSMAAAQDDAAGHAEHAEGAEAAPAVEPPPVLEGEVNLAGLWEIEAELPDGTASVSDLEVTADGDTFSAVLSTELGEAAIDGITVDGNVIEFSADIDMGGILVPFTFSGSTGGDKMNGIIAVDFEGQALLLPIEGVRVGDSASGGLTGEVDLVGTWELEAELPDGTASVSDLVIQDGEGGLVAVLSTELGEATIKGIVIDGNNVSFDTEIDLGGVMVPLSYKGTSGGDDLDGVVSVDFEGQALEMNVVGKKVGAVMLTGAVKLLGEWELEAELPDGTTSVSEMVLEEKDGKITGYLSTEIGEAVIDEMMVDGNKVSYAAEIDMGGVMAPFTFTGSTGDGKIIGTVELDMEGQKMALPITGELVAEPALTGAVDLPGSWEFESELPDGTVSVSELVIEDNDGVLSGTLSTEIGEAVIESITVDGNMISFVANIDMGGVMAPLTFEGSTGDGKIKGNGVLNMEGQEMSLPVTGSKLEAEAMTETAEAGSE